MTDYDRRGGSTYDTVRDHDDNSRGYGSSADAGYGDDRGYRGRGSNEDGRNFAGFDRQGTNYFNESYGSQKGEGHRDRDRPRDSKREWDRDYVAPTDNRSDDSNRDRPIETDESDRLIASDKVEGTRVYDRRGDRLGTIENVMIQKRSGKVEYAVLSFGGFLGMGERHYPLPWHQLTYDERLGGYVVDMTERDLRQAPNHRAGDNARYDRDYSSNIHGYYGMRH